MGRGRLLSVVYDRLLVFVWPLKKKLFRPVCEVVGRGSQEALALGYVEEK